MDSQRNIEHSASNDEANRLGHLSMARGAALLTSSISSRFLRESSTNSVRSVLSCELCIIDPSFEHHLSLRTAATQIFRSTLARSLVQRNCPTTQDSNVIVRYMIYDRLFSLLSAFTGNLTRAQACLSPWDCSQALFQHSSHPLMSSGSDSTEAVSSAYDLWPRSVIQLLVASLLTNSV